LVAEVPEPLEFPLKLTAAPEPIVPNEPATLRFEVRDPWEKRIVDKFTVVHESSFHAFFVSEDLEFFLHEHPNRVGDAFELSVTLPKSGLYRVLTDFLPEAATPQLLSRSLFVAGSRQMRPSLTADYSRKHGVNLEVGLAAPAEDPVAGSATTLRFQLSPVDGIEPYLGVLGHMLVASEDLIDLTHAHPNTTQIGAVAEFSIVFPRPQIYRVWVQFQRAGVVNTVHFDVPVRAGAASADQ
jgi:hypothetical protein